MAGMQEPLKGETQGLPETSGYDSMEREYLEVLLKPAFQIMLDRCSQLFILEKF